MKHAFMGLVFLLTSVTCQIAKATTLDGNEMLEQCGQPVGQAFCYGYVLAWREVMSFGAQMSEISDGEMDSYSSVCEPNNVTNQQALDVALKWIKENPSKRHFSGLQIVNIAWQDAWPCSAEK